MENNKVLFAILATLIVAVPSVVFFVRYIKELKNRNHLLRHRHVCEILEIDGVMPKLTFKRIPELWHGYSYRGTYDEYSFKQSVIKKFVAEVKKMKDIESTVLFLLTYEEVRRIKQVTDQEKGMIDEIYREVCSQTQGRVMLLAHNRYNMIYRKPKSPEKNKEMVSLGLLLDHMCIKNFFPLSKKILDLESEAKLKLATSVSKQKRVKESDTPVIDIGVSATGETKESPAQ